MSKLNRAALAVCILLSSQAFATVFIVPEDKELVQSSDAIVVGVIDGYTCQLTDEGSVETVYRLRVQRSLKGAHKPGSIVEVVSEGGVLKEQNRFLAVVGSAHFEKDDRVLLLLVKENGRWTTNIMTLGKFRFVTSTGGQSLLLRDAEDIVGFDKVMKTHVERIRREKGFLSFIEDTVRGREADTDYFMKPEDAVSLPASEKARYDIQAHAFEPRSYSLFFVSGPDRFPGRWPETRMSASIPRPFFKNSAQNASGFPDGGVQQITDALNAWNNDCGSYVNAPYGGTTANVRNENDGVNVILWNDPANEPTVSGGVIAKAFNAGDVFHTFDGEADWVSLSDVDVVINNGQTGLEAYMNTALTHELGHGLGLRHSDQHGDFTACQVTDECTPTAIMKASVNAAFGFTLQTWDQTAVRALYPSSCGPAAPPAPTGLVATAVSTNQVNLTWNASTGATSYKVLRRLTPGGYTQVAEVSGTSHSDTLGVALNTGYQYVVRASNTGGDSGDSNSDFTVTTVFTDTMADGLTIKAIHFTQLQTAVNALRTLAGLSAFTFTQGTPAIGGTIRKSHLDDLRTALNAARTDPDLGAAAISFGETIVLGTTTVKDTHITELRAGVL